MTTETLQDTIDAIIPAPDADLVTHIIASWGGNVDIAAKIIPENVNYSKLGASPNGEATAFYVDVDGDTQKRERLDKLAAAERTVKRKAI